MNIYTSLLLIAFSSSATGNVWNEPTCSGLLRLTASGTNRYLKKGLALCDGVWSFGINDESLFALWKNGEVFEQFATGADIIELSEADEGREVFLSVKDTEGDLIWEIGCVDQPVNTTARLAINDAANVIKFAKVNRLWSVLDTGRVNVDDRCIVVNESKEDTGLVNTGTGLSGDEADEPTYSPTEYPTASPTEEEIWTENEDEEWYDCEENSPCTVKNINEEKFYFPAANAESYIQCGTVPEMCFVRDCGVGTIWDQNYLTCVSAGQNVYMSLLCKALKIPSMCA